MDAGQAQFLHGTFTVRALDASAVNESRRSLTRPPSITRSIPEC